MALVKIESRVGVLTGVLMLPAVERPRCVVGSHGLYSDRESTKLVELGESLVRRGMAFLRYDCMACGDSEGAFADTTLQSRVTDLEEVLAWVRRQSFLQSDRVGLMGSSMGGFSSLCVAAADPGVAGVAAWAAPAAFDDLHDEDQEQAVEPAEGVWVPPALGPAFYRTLDQPDLVAIAPSLRDVIFLHGEKDETVPLDHAVQLHGLARDPKQIVVFPGGDHRFADDGQRAEAVALSTDWLATRLLD